MIFYLSHREQKNAQEHLENFTGLEFCLLSQMEDLYCPFKLFNTESFYSIIPRNTFDSDLTVYQQSEVKEFCLLITNLVVCLHFIQCNSSDIMLFKNIPWVYIYKNKLAN